MEFRCYTGLKDLPASAQQLFEDSAKTSVFFSRPWLENLENSISHDEQRVLLACVIDREDVLAILPLTQQEGNHLFSLNHFYSSLVTLSIAPHNQPQIIQCLAQGLDKMGITSLRLDPVADDDSRVEGLQLAMEALGYESHRHFRFYNWVHPLQGQSFADYMAARPSRVRNTISRKQRKLQREHGYHVHLYSDRDLDRGLADYNTIYKASWKAHEQHETFVEKLARKLSASGWLRLAVLYINEKPAAAQFWFVVHGKASIFKLVYDQHWRRYSPGSILISHLMEQVIKIDKVEEIDFLTGNDAYKQDWMSLRRQRWQLSLFKPKKQKGLIERFVDPLKLTLPINRL